MNKLAILTAAVTLSAFAPVIHAATIGNSTDTVKLNACQIHFGQSGQETHIYGVLPLEMDYFFGTVQIGERSQADAVTAITPFTGGSMTYHEHITGKADHRTLMRENSGLSSHCEDFLNMDVAETEGISLQWSGKNPDRSMGAWSLDYHSLKKFSCYIGLTSVKGKIVLMCANLSPFLYGSQVLDELRALLSDAEVVDKVCTYSKKKGRTRLNDEKKCRANIERLVQPGFE